MGLTQMFTTDATSLNRLMNCNGSRLMGGENSPMNAAPIVDGRDEGNAAHWLAQRTFCSDRIENDFIDQKAPNGFFITQDIAEHVGDYNNYIEEHAGSVEFESSFGNDLFQVNCRADHIGVKNGILHIDDFKYGWRIVEPDMNWTLIAHAIGYFIQNPQHTIAQIKFTVIQPRPGHPLGSVRSWQIDYGEFVKLWQKVYDTLSNLSEDLNTGSHCAKCPSLFNCPAARMASMNSIEASTVAHDDEIDNALLSFELDTLYRAKSALISRLEALEELAINRSMKGEVVENYAIERGLGNTTWAKGITPEMIEALTGVDVVSGKMITPNQAIKKHANETAVKALTYRPQTGMKLKRIDANKKAQRIFNT